MERREKLVDIERKSNPHTKGEVLIKKEDERRIAHKGQNSVGKTEHKESNLEKDLFKAK